MIRSSLLLAFLLAACGQTGPLVLPDARQAPVPATAPVAPPPATPAEPEKTPEEGPK